MDDLVRTDKLGHWCARYAATTSDALGAVQAWYRKALLGASETNLIDDERYKSFANLDGIKMAVGIDSVTIFRVPPGLTTQIELIRCSSTK